jgi:hypothetical protein
MRCVSVDARILSNKFSESTSVPTLGSELFLKEETFKKYVGLDSCAFDVHVEDIRYSLALPLSALHSEKTTLCIWDCSGAERYRPMLQQLYTNEPVKGVILMSVLHRMEATRSLACEWLLNLPSFFCCPGTT